MDIDQAMNVPEMGEMELDPPLQQTTDFDIQLDEPMSPHDVEAAGIEEGEDLHMLPAHEEHPPEADLAPTTASTPDAAVAVPDPVDQSTSHTDTPAEPVQGPGDLLQEQVAEPLPPASVQDLEETHAEDAIDDLDQPEELEEETEEDLAAVATDAHRQEDAEEPDELATREATPGGPEQEVPEEEDQVDPLEDLIRPTPRLDWLAAVNTRPLPNPAASSSQAVRAPPVKLSYFNETYWLFAEDPAEQETPVAASADSAHHPTGVLPMLLTEADELYYTSLVSVFARLHKHFDDFIINESEMVLCMPEGFGIDLGEDDYYSREISLYDLDRIHQGCDGPGRLHLTLNSRVRAITRFNVLARHVGLYTGLLEAAEDAPNPLGAVLRDAASTSNDDDELNNSKDDATYAGDEETEATALDDLLQDEDDDKAAEADELDDAEDALAAPEQYEDAVDESGLQEAQHLNGVDAADAESAAEEDESAPDLDPNTDAAAPDPHEADNVDELHQADVPAAEDNTVAVDEASEAVTIQETLVGVDDEPTPAPSDKLESAKSPKRQRDDTNTAGAAQLVADLTPDAKRARAS